MAIRMTNYKTSLRLTPLGWFTVVLTAVRAFLFVKLVESGLVLGAQGRWWWVALAATVAVVNVWHAHRDVFGLLRERDAAMEAVKKFEREMDRED